MGNFDFFRLNFPKNGFWGQNFEVLSLDSESAPPYHEFQFSDKKDTFYFFDQNLFKNRFWDQNFERISPDTESAPPGYLVC